MGELDPKSSRAPYLQVADRLLGDIVRGDLTPGDQLASLPTLAERFEVAIGTVRSAIAVLRDRGLVVTRQGTGSFVRDDLDPQSLSESSPSRAADLAEIKRLRGEINGRLADLERRLPIE